MTRRARLALRLAACALAGAVLTVAVAWATTRASPRLSSHRLNVPWPTCVPSHWPAASFSVQESRGRGIVILDGMAVANGRLFRLQYITAGWPSRSMGMAMWVDPFGVRKNGIALGSLGISADAGTFERLPGRILWPGFALDTLFYGGLVFLLWSAPGVIRRRIRKRRGRCPACGYDLRGSPAGRCPECGT